MMIFYLVKAQSFPWLGQPLANEMNDLQPEVLIQQRHRPFLGLVHPDTQPSICLTNGVTLQSIVIVTINNIIMNLQLLTSVLTGHGKAATQECNFFQTHSGHLDQTIGLTNKLQQRDVIFSMLKDAGTSLFLEPRTTFEISASPLNISS